MKQPCVCLLIDDDLDDQEIFSSALSDTVPEAVCYTAMDGTEALQKLISREFVPDLIFVDLNMPKMNGYEFLQEIKRIQDLMHIPVVVHSTTVQKNEIEDLMKLGAYDVHIKDNHYKSMCKMLTRFMLRICKLGETNVGVDERMVDSGP